MRLINRNPSDFVGRTIFHRHVAWRVDGVDDEHVLLSKPGLNQKGRLRHHLFAECILYPEPAEIRTRFPMLLRALRTVCNLTTAESENAILGTITHGIFFNGSEALAHLGGSGNAIGLCWRNRTRVRESFARWSQPA
jgi:hypothetical protein